MKTKTKILHTIITVLLIVLMFLIFPYKEGVPDYIGPENIREIELQKENAPITYQGIISLFAIIYIILIWLSSDNDENNEDLNEMIKSIFNKNY